MIEGIDNRWIASIFFKNGLHDITYIEADSKEIASCKLKKYIEDESLDSLKIQSLMLLNIEEIVEIKG